MLQILRDKNKTVQCIAPFSPTQENAWNIQDLTREPKKTDTTLHVSHEDLTHKTYTN